MIDDNRSFYHALAESLSREPGSIRLTGGGQSFDGAALHAAIERWAGALASLGVRAGDRVAVQAEKSIELVLLYLATLRIGAVYVPLNTAYRTAEIDYFLGDAEPAIFVCDPSAADACIGLQGCDGSLWTLDGDGGGTLAGIVAAAGYEAPPASVGPDDLAAIVYTSGTTGRSKGAMITHRNLLANARALIAAWRIEPDDTLLHVLPLYHIHGLFVALNTMLLAGGRTNLAAGFDSGAAIAGFARATIFMGVPTYYTRLLNETRLNQQATEGIRLFVCGSAPLTPATFEAFGARTGQVILERYGMSECGIICSNPIDGPRIAGAVGLPLPGVEVRISDEAAVGVLEVRGSSVFSGYWRQPEKTLTEFREDGFFITGDIATIDDEGVVRIVGREKDMVISGGLNVYPKEIETLIDLFEEVDESAVIGLAHADFGEAVVAVVRLHPGAALDQAAAIARLKADLAGFKLPKAVFFVDNLPRNAMGKVQKAALRERFSCHFEA
jgi:malonyl-CoA/methylmalonyl-CoA synthetase